MRATPAAGTLAFPLEPEQTVPLPRQFVQASPAPGGQLRLTYVDADLEPRIELTVDPMASEDDQALLRRILKAVGDRLPPLRRPAPLFGPRLVPGVFALQAFDFLLQFPAFA